MILTLTLKEPYFTMTGSEGKMYELRRNTKWIRSRLYSKDGKPRFYNHVRLINGYSKQAPIKLVQYLGFKVIQKNMLFKLPSGEMIYMFAGDYFIILG